MPKKGHSEVQIPRALGPAQSGTEVSKICREQEISDARFYICKEEVVPARRATRPNEKWPMDFVATLALDGRWFY